MIKTHITNARIIVFLVFLCVLLFGKFPAFASQATNFENNPEVIAQWNLNVGSLALDEYQYLDALAYFEDAFETSKMAKTQVRALLYKATTFATFLHSPDSALKIYQYIQKEFPGFAETASYQEVLLLFEEERYPEVIAKTRAYAKNYPGGRFQFQAELLLEQSEKIMLTKKYQEKQRLQNEIQLQNEARQRKDGQRKAALEAMQAEVARLKAEAEANARESARLQAEAEANARESAQMAVKARLQEAASLKAKAEDEIIRAEQLQKKAVAAEKVRAKEKKESLEVLQSLAVRDFKLSEEPVVRVLLSKSATDVFLQGNDLLLHVDGETNQVGEKIRLKTIRSVIVQDNQNGTTFGENVKITGDGPIEVTYGPKKKHKVRGFLLLSANGKGIRVINHVKMEAYLRSVVPSESISSWKMDALKAQALAARTYAYDHIISHAKKPFDVYATHRSQVYGGVDKERTKTDQAIKETSGEIITAVINGKMRPILAMYAANSGGHTADPKKEYDPHWDPPHYLIAQKDPWSVKAGKSGLATWKYTHTLKYVEKNLAKRRIDVPNLVGIDPTYIGPSGRVVTVRLLYGGGKSKSVRFRPKVTKGLGNPRLNTLPDTIVTINKKGSSLVFDGKGFGHGIGYMQYGGQYMAKAGYSYKEILGFYYPQTKIVHYWK